MNATGFFGLIRDTFRKWSADKVPVQAAALAYYTVFAIAPLLLILIAVVGLVLGEQAVRGQLFAQLRGAVGDNTAELIQNMVARTGRGNSGILATIIGIIIVLVGATGLFGQLQRTLNLIWGVDPKRKGIKGLLWNRLLSFGMILLIGLLFLAAFLSSAAISALSGFFGDSLPGSAVLWRIIDLLASLAVFTILFAAIYKILPDTDVPWGDVWIGAIVTAVLFVIGKFLIGLYLGRASVTSTYGAAGSLVALLLWVYYSAQIILLGAEFTQAYARRYGSKITSQGTQNAPAQT